MAREGREALENKLKPKATTMGIYSYLGYRFSYLGYLQNASRIVPNLPTPFPFSTETTSYSYLPRNSI